MNVLTPLLCLLLSLASAQSLQDLQRAIIAKTWHTLFIQHIPTITNQLYPYQTTEFIYHHNNTFQAFKTYYNDSLRSTIIFKIQLKGSFQWKDANPIANMAYNLQTTINLMIQITPLTQDFVDLLNNCCYISQSWTANQPLDVVGKDFPLFGLVKGTYYVDNDILYYQDGLLYQAAKNSDWSQTKETPPTNLFIPLATSDYQCGTLSLEQFKQRLKGQQWRSVAVELQPMALGINQYQTREYNFSSGDKFRLLEKIYEDPLGVKLKFTRLFNGHLIYQGANQIAAGAYNVIKMYDGEVWMTVFDRIYVNELNSNNEPDMLPWKLGVAMNVSLQSLTSLGITMSQQDLIYICKNNLFWGDPTTRLVDVKPTTLGMNLVTNLSVSEQQALVQSKQSDLKNQIVNKVWQSLAIEVRNKINSTGFPVTEFLIRKYLYFSNDTVEGFETYFLSPSQELKYKIHFIGSVAWKQPHPVAYGAFNVLYIIDKLFEVTPVDLKFTQYLNTLQLPEGLQQWQSNVPFNVLGKSFPLLGIIKGTYYTYNDILFLQANFLYQAAPNNNDSQLLPTSLFVPLLQMDQLYERPLKEINFLVRSNYWKSFVVEQRDYLENKIVKPTYVTREFNFSEKNGFSSILSEFNDPLGQNLIKKTQLSGHIVWSQPNLLVQGAQSITLKYDGSIIVTAFTESIINKLNSAKEVDDPLWKIGVPNNLTGRTVQPFNLQGGQISTSNDLVFLFNQRLFFGNGANYTNFPAAANSSPTNLQIDLVAYQINTYNSNPNNYNRIKQKLLSQLWQSISLEVRPFLDSFQFLKRQFTYYQNNTVELLQVHFRDQQGQIPIFKANFKGFVEFSSPFKQIKEAFNVKYIMNLSILITPLDNDFLTVLNSRSKPVGLSAWVLNSSFDVLNSEFTYLGLKQDTTYVDYDILYQKDCFLYQGANQNGSPSTPDNLKYTFSVPLINNYSSCENPTLPLFADILQSKSWVSLAVETNNSSNYLTREINFTSNKILGKFTYYSDPSSQDTLYTVIFVYRISLYNSVFPVFGIKIEAEEKLEVTIFNQQTLIQFNANRQSGYPLWALKVNYDITGLTIKNINKPFFSDLLYYCRNSLFFGNDFFQPSTPTSFGNNLVGLTSFQVDNLQKSNIEALKLQIVNMEWQSIAVELTPNFNLTSTYSTRKCIFYNNDTFEAFFTYFTEQFGSRIQSKTHFTGLITFGSVHPLIKGAFNVQYKVDQSVQVTPVDPEFVNYLNSLPKPDGLTLWQQNIPFNMDTSNFAMYGFTLFQFDILYYSDGFLYQAAKHVDATTTTLDYPATSLFVPLINSQCEVLSREQIKQSLLGKIWKSFAVEQRPFLIANKAIPEYLTREYIFSEDEMFSAKYIFFEDSLGLIKLLSIQYGGKIVWNNKNKMQNLEKQIEYSYLTPLNQLSVVKLNLRKEFGFADWEQGVERNITIPGAFQDIAFICRGYLFEGSPSVDGKSIQLMNLGINLVSETITKVEENSTNSTIPKTSLVAPNDSTGFMMGALLIINMIN